MTMLSDGSIFTAGGSWGGVALGNKTGEVWDISTETWSVKRNLVDAPLVTDDDRGLYRSDNHYWLFVAPNGKVFHAGPSFNMHWIDTAGDGRVTSTLVRGDDAHSMNGNAVMYDVGKILKVGGSPNYDDKPANNHAYVIDINGGEGGETVRRVNDMNAARSMCNSVVLPNGQVIVVGGMTVTALFSDHLAVMPAEIWDPVTEEFTLLEDMHTPRTYHSMAILMKDGRVLSGGGGLCGSGCSANHKDIEILTPPYLFDANGNPAIRPEILSAPSSARYGEALRVRMDTDDPHTFALMRLGAATHSLNNDARRIPLKAVSLGNGDFDLSVPSNRHVALTGLYWLFAMNVDGVPSVGSTLSISLPP